MKTFVVVFHENPQGGRPIGRHSGIIVMPERTLNWSPQLEIETEVRLWQNYANGRSGVLYVAPVSGTENEVT